MVTEQIPYQFTVCPNCGFTTDCTPSEAADQLLGLMVEISEDRYCAGWLINLEYELWEEVLNGDLPIARMLSDKAGGWWIWDSNAEETHRRRFVPINEWLIMYQARIDKRPQRKRRPQMTEQTPAEWFDEQLKDAQGDIDYWTDTIDDRLTDIKICTNELARALELACSGNSNSIKQCLMQARKEYEETQDE